MTVLRDGMTKTNNQTGSVMSGALTPDEEAKKRMQQEQVASGAFTQPQTPAAGSATIGGRTSATQPSPAAKAAPQKAGTGTFTNLRKYLEAAQGKGQQKVAQAATGQIQRLGAGAQKGLETAKGTFASQMQAGSLRGMETAGQEAADIVKAARGVTYQVPQKTPAQVQIPPTGSDFSEKIQTNPRDQYFKDLLGDKYQDFVNDRRSMVKTISTMDRIWNPDTGTFGPSITRTFGEDELYAKYGIDKNKIPTQPQRVGGPALPPAGTFRSKTEPYNLEGMVKSETEIPTTPTQPQPQAPVQSQQYFTPEQQQRFAQIINAQYQGPMSLEETGGFAEAARKARTAEQAAQLTQTATGREQLLRDIFGRQREYGRGASRLDAMLLNASQQGVQQLQQQAQPALQARSALQSAQSELANEAMQRARAIEQVRSGAREALTTARTKEEAAVDERLSRVVANWENLPNYFKDILRNREKGTAALSQKEAEMLGVGSGVGLYNLTPEQIIQTNQAERARLITKDELSRQLALQQLANLDVSNQLQKDLLYTDLEKAGTQTALDALNRRAIQDVLAAEEKKFQDTAAGQTLTGYGSKKHRQTGKRYYADESANLKDLLSRAGYQFAPTETAPSAAGVGAGASGKVTTDKDAPEINKDFLQPNFSAALDPYTSSQNDLIKAGYLAADIGTLGGSAAVRSLIGYDPISLITGALGQTVSSRYAKDIAARGARQDLQRKVTQALQDAGFENRAVIGDTPEVLARQAALEQILAGGSYSPNIAPLTQEEAELPAPAVRIG